MGEKKPKAIQHWYTTDELHFLEKLGSYGLKPDQERERKAALLRQYLQAMPLRQSWGDIQPGIVRAHAEALLSRLVR